MPNPIANDIWYANKDNKPYTILRVFRNNNIITSIELTDNKNKYSLSENEFRDKFRFIK